VETQETLGQDPPKFVNALLGSEVIRMDRVWADNRVSLHFLPPCWGKTEGDECPKSPEAFSSKNPLYFNELGRYFARIF
jgi:hypothetical protein